MRFNTKNPKFLTDLFTLIFALTVITVTVLVIISGSDTMLGIVFYAGAAMFAANIVRGFISGKYMAAVFIIPAAICVTGGLIAQGVISPWIF